MKNNKLTERKLEKTLKKGVRNFAKWMSCTEKIMESFKAKKNK